MIRTVLSIDPGSAKCGMAVVQRNGHEIKVLWRKIARREEILQAIEEAVKTSEFNTIVIGGGTTSKELVRDIRDGYPGLSPLIVDEKDTTLQARERYWEHTPRFGWRRLVPASLQVPPEPVDDFVAVILAERVLLA